MQKLLIIVAFACIAFCLAKQSGDEAVTQATIEKVTEAAAKVEPAKENEKLVEAPAKTATLADQTPKPEVQPADVKAALLKEVEPIAEEATYFQTAILPEPRTPVTPMKVNKNDKKKKN